MDRNSLWRGDNLDVLRRHVADGAVDLAYLDPPFNSRADYHVHAETRAGGPVAAFADTWEWDDAAYRSYRAFLDAPETPEPARRTLAALHDVLGGRDRTGNRMIAYLAMIAPRLREVRRVLGPTGSLYLHCDPTASHYLKVILDALFGPRSFRNEIVWRRTGSHNKVRRYAPIHDILLFYTKDPDRWTWNPPRKPYMRGHIDRNCTRDEAGWRTNYYGNVLTGSGIRNGESGRPWRGFDPSAKQRHWAIPRAVLVDILAATGEDLGDLGQHEKLERLLELGYIKIEPGQAWPVYERRLGTGDGIPVPDLWAFQPYTEGTVFETERGIDDEVRWLPPRDPERSGYPTQKPEGLLARLVAASSRPGDLVLDPFCGGGTTLAVAQRLDRRWLGIDASAAAIELTRRRLEARFGETIQAMMIEA